MTGRNRAPLTAGPASGPAGPGTAAGGPGAAGPVRLLASDTWVLTRRELDRWARRPAPLVVATLFPVLTTLMFAYLFGGALTVPGGGGYREFLLPGMLTMAMLFGLESTMTAVATDAARGVTDRLRSLPMASTAVLLGRCTADLLASAAGLAVLLAVGRAIGWQPRAGAGAAVAAVGLLLLLRVALLWAGIWLGLVADGPESVAAVQILVWPLGFLSSAFVAPATMPAWLGAVAAWNPLSATATATRQLFGNPVATGGSWAAEHAVVLAVAWPLVILAVALPAAARRYRHLDR
jgi:ABC-2 type transport system permease protein